MNYNMVSNWYIFYVYYIKGEQNNKQQKNKQSRAKEVKLIPSKRRNRENIFKKNGEESRLRQRILIDAVKKEEQRIKINFK